MKLPDLRQFAVLVLFQELFPAIRCNLFAIPLRCIEDFPSLRYE